VGLGRAPNLECKHLTPPFDSTLSAAPSDSPLYVVESVHEISLIAKIEIERRTRLGLCLVVSPKDERASLYAESFSHLRRAIPEVRVPGLLSNCRERARLKRLNPPFVWRSKDAEQPARRLIQCGWLFRTRKGNHPEGDERIRRHVKQWCRCAVVLKSGHLSASQMEGLSKVARDFGSGFFQTP